VQVGVRRQRWHGVGNRCADFGSLQQRQVVFRVTSGDRVVRRQAKLIQCREQPGALGHPGREDHRGAAVMHYLAVQAETGDDFHRGDGVFRGQREKHAASASGHSAASQRALHGGVDRARQRPRAGSGVQYGTVSVTSASNSRQSPGNAVSRSSKIRPVTKIIRRSSRQALIAAIPFSVS
jgi:hypothetical protein